MARPQSPQYWPPVVAIIPARNEAETIGKTIASLARQEYSGEFSIIVVDDHSSDETATLAHKAAQENGATERITIHAATELPPGWTGKLWALNEGVTKATTEKEPPEFFWFTDADIVHAPDTLFRLVSRAEQSHSDLVSLMVLLQAETIPERLLIPPFLYFFLMLYPPQWIANRQSRTAGAAGGCILLRRKSLECIGGLAAIRQEVIDDCALARATKSSGGKTWMGLTRASVSLRSYRSFGEIRDLIARTAFTQLRYSSVLLLGTLISLFITYLLAWVISFAATGNLRLIGAATVFLMTASFLPTVRFYKLSPLWALTLPIAAIFYGYSTWLSAIRYWRGKGGQWKGRAQAPPKT